MPAALPNEPGAVQISRDSSSHALRVIMGRLRAMLVYTASSADLGPRSSCPGPRFALTQVREKDEVAGRLNALRNEVKSTIDQVMQDR